MDPITTAIVAALAALSKDAIKDGYNALKSTLKKKFGSESDLVDAVEKKVADMSEQEEIKQRVTEAEYAATSATGDAHITITNRW
ncbi:MAG: hypothetical protein WA896_02595 [Spirulinaceae cyanobacterium]